MSAAASNEPTFKRQKVGNHQSYKHRKKQFMEAGQRGFLATCNFREKDCVRECYNILNQYADELYGEQQNAVEVTTKKIASADEQKEHVDVKADTNNDEDGSNEDDIADTLQKEINAMKQNNKNKSAQKPRFQVVDTGTTNCLFIRTTLPDPVELGMTIVRDICATKQQKTRHLLRLLPIDIVCHANVADILKAAGQLFDKHFLKTPTTFSIAFNKRYNNSLHRDDVIPDLAELVRAKNPENKVDLKHSKKTIILEIVKGLCCLAVVEDYLQHKKYNLVELATNNNVKPDESQKQSDDVKQQQEDDDNKSDVLPPVA